MGMEGFGALCKVNFYFNKGNLFNYFVTISCARNKMLEYVNMQVVRVYNSKKMGRDLMKTNLFWQP